MLVPLAASAVVTLVVAFGVGGVAVVLLLAGLFVMLEPHDRRALRGHLRHPLRALLGLEDSARRR